MKFLVLGASGMAGHMISIYLKELKHDVTGFTRKKMDFIDSIVGDAVNLEFVRGVIKQGRYDCIINCIGILNQDAEVNKYDASFLNGFYPHFLAEITKDMDTQVIQISTDCVFSGKVGGYTETSIRDGETFYDRSKAIGELEDNKNLTLRNSIIGPDINCNGVGLFNWFMKQNGIINGYTKVMWTGMTTLQLAKIIEKAAIQRVTGLYNMVPDHNISKYELLKLFNHYFRDDEIEIKPFDHYILDKTLVRTRFEFTETVPDYKTMVREMADWMRRHRELYPHYDL